MGPHYLKDLFEPSSIAVVGASERPNSVGTRVFANLLASGFHGRLYPINPKHATIQGQTCYPDVTALDETVDLVVIATPAPTVPDLIEQAGAQGVKAAIVLSAGFGEAGPTGRRLQNRMLENANRYGMRIIGPNCLGVIRPRVGMNATFSKNGATAGDLALVSQSGALCTAILDWAESRQVGFSAVVSTGAAADVDFGDVLSYLALDPQTRSILLYIEGIHNARSFLSGLRVAARMKPVIVVKSGRHAEGSRAAMSHTGALVGGDDVFNVALERAGAVRATTIEQLFSAAQILSTAGSLRGRRLAILTNGGGPGVMATDRAVEQDVTVAELSPSSLEQLDQVLPAHWSRGNPLDILGDAPPERYESALRTCLADDGIDGVLAMLTPQAMTEPTAAAEAVIRVVQESESQPHKPVMACWLGEEQVAEARERFAAVRIPHFDNPEASVEAFGYLAAYKRNQELLFQVPGTLSEQSEPDPAGARLIIEGALAEGRDVLTTLESKALLSAFRIPVMHTVESRSANEALVAAESVGFPVVMKVSSKTLSHKSDIGGVRLNINSAQMVRNVFKEMTQAVQQNAPGATLDGITVEHMYTGRNGRELLVGVVRDPVFGPVISFGAGGTAVEVIKDRALALPPLNPFLIRPLIDRTKVSRMLGAFRNMPPVDREALESTLIRISEMVCELPEVQELDINPLIADENGVIAVDARVKVAFRPPSLEPYSHMAIHPYPGHLVSHWQLGDGTNYTVRPIRPEDAELTQRFVRNLSDESKYFRYMQTLQELNREMLIRFTQIDYDQEMALIAVTQEAADTEVELGVARYTINPDGQSCEFALVVADNWRRRGIGSRLMQCLMDTARSKGLHIMEGEVLSSNVDMLGLVEHLGFVIRTREDDPSIKHVSKRL